MEQEDPNLRPFTRTEMNALEDEIQFLHRAFVTERMLIVDMMKGVVSADGFPIEGTLPHPLALMCRVLVLLINSVPEAKHFVSFGFTDQTTGELFSLRITRGDDRTVERLAESWAARVVELEAKVAADEVYLGMVNDSAAAAARDADLIMERLHAEIAELRADLARAGGS